MSSAFLRDGSFTFTLSCLSSENINYLISDAAGTMFYVILFVICILVTFILYIDDAPSVRIKIIIIMSFVMYYICCVTVVVLDCDRTKT